jgi:hypothetical protein
VGLKRTWLEQAATPGAKSGTPPSRIAADRRTRSLFLNLLTAGSYVLVLGDCKFQSWRNATKHYSAWGRFVLGDA